MIPLVGQETDGPQILQSLLHEITARDIGSTTKHHNLLACLYVHHAPSRFLNFLREPLVTTLDYTKLSQLARQKRMFGELAYIMGRSGDATEAIRLVVRCLRDVKFAIQFVEDTDPQLWDELIRHVMQAPALVGSFLDAGIGHYDMAKFLEKIPKENRLMVPHCSTRLGNVIVEQAISCALNETSLNSHREENFQLLRDHYNKARGAVRCYGGGGLGSGGSTMTCSACRMPIDIGASEQRFVFSVAGRVLHAACAEPEAGQIPSVPFDQTKLVQRESRRKRAWRMARDPAHQLASIEVFRDAEMYDICEVLPRALRFAVFSFLDSDSVNDAKLVSRSWYLHLRALACGLGHEQQTNSSSFLAERTAFQHYMWHHGSFPARPVPFIMDDEDDFLSNTAGLHAGTTMDQRLAPLRRCEDLPVPVGPDVFIPRQSS